MEQQHCITVTEEDRGKRIDKILATALANVGISREKVKQLIKDGLVLLDDTVCSSPKETVRLGAVITVTLPATTSCVRPEEGYLEVLYKDTELAVINKPAHLTVHPCPSCEEGTLVHRLVSHFPELTKVPGLRPGIVHRLDKDTSGLLLIAMTERSRLALAEMFAERTIHKEYLALVYGVPYQPSGEINVPIGRHAVKKVMMAVTDNGKEAHSAWRTVYADPKGRFSLLAVQIFTGRTHQIRVHLSYLGHPLVGDDIYTFASTADFRKHPGKAPTMGTTAAFHAPRQMLHAWQLNLQHPFPQLAQTSTETVTLDEHKTISAVCPPPEDFTETLQHLVSPLTRVIVTGSPGCGKSTVLTIAQQEGIPVFSADAFIKELYEPNNYGWHLLRGRFGNRFVPSASAPVDKRALANAMQEDESVRHEVEHLIHPLVQKAMQEFWDENEQKGAPLALAEIPLFPETWKKNRNQAKHQEKRYCELQAPETPLLLGVYCPFATRQKRMLEKRNWSEETIAMMESWQLHEHEKMQHCHIVIPNTGSEEELHTRARALFSWFITLRRKRARAVVESILKKC